MKKRGFVYVWYDSKSKKFYVGSHWGEPADHYVCSSTWMRMSHKRHPETFKRRIVDWVYLDEVQSLFPNLRGDNSRDLIRRAKFELLMVEQRWLYMIPESQLGTAENQKKGTARYYNITRQTDKLWHVSYGDDAYLSTRERLSKSLKSFFANNPDAKRLLSERVSRSLTGKKRKPFTEEHRANIQAARAKQVMVRKLLSERFHNKVCPVCSEPFRVTYEDRRQKRCSVECETVAKQTQWERRSRMATAYHKRRRLQPSDDASR